MSGADDDAGAWGFDTRAIHAGQSPDPTTGAIMTPVYMTSTYVQSSPGVNKGYDYSRTINPTRVALEGKGKGGANRSAIGARIVVRSGDLVATLIAKYSGRADVSPDTTIEDCMALMTEQRIRHLPVAEHGHIVGAKNSEGAYRAAPYNPPGDGQGQPQHGQ